MADPLQALNRIIQSQQERERFDVQTSLQMMQFAQQKRMQDIALAKDNIQMATKSLEMIKPKIASDFLNKSRLSQFYIPTEEGDAAGDAISEMVIKLRHKNAFSKSLPELEAQKIATALWSYYGEAKDPEPILGLARDLKSSVVSAMQDDKGGAALYEAFKKLGVDSEMHEIVNQATRVRTSENLIHKEMNEFLKGDYEIQSDIGVYKDVKARLGQYVSGDPISQEELDSMADEIIGTVNTDSDINWTPIVGSGAAIATYLIAQGMEPHLAKEMQRYREGYASFARKVHRDLRSPLAKRYKKGVKENTFFRKYGLKKKRFLARDPEQMKIFNRLARQHARKNLKSITDFEKARNWVKNIKVTGRMKDLLQAIPGKATLGKISRFGIPMFGAEIVGSMFTDDKLGEMAGHGVGGTTFLAYAAKRFPKVAAKFTAKAGARHLAATSASALSGPAAPGVALVSNVIMGFVDAGLGLYEFYQLYEDYKEYKAGRGN